MSRGVNKVLAIGNLTANPEQREAGEHTVASFSIAVNGFKEGDVEFISVECWNKTAEFVCQYLEKGSKVWIEGRMKTDRYEKEGVTHYRTKVVAQEVQSLRSQGAASKPGAGPGPDSQQDSDDPIPF